MKLIRVSEDEKVVSVERLTETEDETDDTIDKVDSGVEVTQNTES